MSTHKQNGPENIEISSIHIKYVDYVTVFFLLEQEKGVSLNEKFPMLITFQWLLSYP